VLILVLFLVSQALRVGSDMWLSFWSDEDTLSSLSDNTIIGIYWAFVSSTLVFALARSFTFMSEVALNSSRRIHALAFGLLMRASVPKFFDVTPVGRLLNLLSKDLDQLDILLPVTLYSLLQNMFILIGVLGVCIAGSAWMALVFVPIAFCFVGVQAYFRNSQRELKRIENTTRSPIFSLFGETLQGLSVIRAYGVENEFAQRNARVVEGNSKVFALLWWSQRWLALRLDWVSVLVVIAVCLLVVGLREQLSVTVASLALVYSLQFMGLLQLTVRNSVDVENYLQSVERLMAFKRIAVERPAIIAETQPPPEWPTRGDIELRDLQLRYRDDLPLVLKGVSCKINAKEKIGICGRTGSGKSSLMVALFRLCEPSGGQILIDGVDVATLGLETLRSALSIIPQDPVMFSSTLRYNLDPFDKCSDAAIREVLERVHLTDLVTSFPDGLQHEISEGGENLSQGTRQLVCIARALLRRSRIIILDEATSSVDAETDALIQETIRVNFADATVLSIAHRLDTIVDADRILLMSDGRPIEFDTPATLLTTESSFKALVAEGGAANLARLQGLALEADAARRAQGKGPSPQEPAA